MPTSLPPVNRDLLTYSPIGKGRAEYTRATAIAKNVARYAGLDPRQLTHIGTADGFHWFQVDGTSRHIQVRIR